MLNTFAFLGLMLIPVFTFSSGQTHRESASHEQLPRPKSSRVVAVTIDDLPVAGAAEGDLRRAQQVTAKLLKQITAHNIPVVGFVNERKTHVPGKEKEWTDLLRQWADVGLELGNHTYSHRSFQETPLEEFEAEVIRGETVIARLMRERRGMGLRYFRHPYLQTGSDPETKKAFERFLAERGYTVAPVTVGHYDWLYAAAYDKAQGNGALMKKVGKAYLDYMVEDFKFNEQLSRDVLGYEVRQVLLLHANALNADYLDEVVKMMKRRGYKFIPLGEALQDEAYHRGDPYTGPLPMTWLQRWAIGQGGNPRKIPPAHAFVRELSGMKEIIKDMERDEK